MCDSIVEDPTKQTLRRGKCTKELKKFKMVQQLACHVLKVSLMTKGLCTKFNVRFAPMWK
jgi:hypothetical protein